MIALTLQKALPDLVYIALTIMLVLPILAVVLCLFQTHRDDGFFTYRGQHSFIDLPFSYTAVKPCLTVYMPSHRPCRHVKAMPRLYMPAACDRHS